MAEHYNIAIVPARVSAPQDKSYAEGSVQFAETWIIAALRNQKFFSLEGVSNAVAEKLKELNNRAFKKRVGNRTEAYLKEEKPSSALKLILIKGVKSMNNTASEADTILRPLRSYMLSIALCQLSFGILIFFNWFGSYRDYYAAFPILVVYKNYFAASIVVLAALSFIVRRQINCVNRKIYKVAVVSTVAYFCASIFFPLIYEIACDSVTGIQFNNMEMLVIFVYVILAAKNIRYLIRYKEFLKD